MIRRTLTVLTIAFVATIAKGQTSNGLYNSILWRITAPGSNKPSYLFGTIHVTDKRVFFFSDSLYHALEQTEGFATELDMMQFATHYLSDYIDAEKNSDEVSLVDTVSEQVITKYSKALQKKTGKPLNKISTKDIKAGSDVFYAKMLQEGEMPTFMDAYLYSIAKNQGKWTGGIEDFEDQAVLLKDRDTSVEDKIQTFLAEDNRRAKLSMEWMISTYLSQNLDIIDKTDELWQGSKDEVLIKRNNKMSRRIDSIMQFRSCVFAVGAAHLPGDSGVITLLRKRGYQIEPVYSSVKIDPAKYDYKKLQRPWTEFVSADSSYLISAPNAMTKFKLNNFSDLYMDFDIGAMRAFCTISVPAGAQTVGASEKMFSNLADNYKKKAISFEEKDIEIAGQKSKEFVFALPEGTTRLQIAIGSTSIIMNYMFALQRVSLFNDEASKFFQSFQLLKSPSKETVSTAWKTYDFTSKGFTAAFPGQYTQKSITSDSNWKRQQYQLVDIENDIFYGIIISDAFPGHRSDSDSAYFQLSINSTNKAFKGKVISSNNFLFQGYPAYETVLEGGNANPVRIRMFMVNRADRRYAVFTSYTETGNGERIDSFFKSFKLLSLPAGQWQRQESPDHSFSLWSPSAIIKYEGFAANEQLYYVHDSLQPMTAFVHKKPVPEYYWTASDSAYYEMQLESFIGDDSLVSKTKVTSGDIEGREVVIKLADNHNLKKIRLFLNGDTAYTVFQFSPQELLVSENYQRLHDEFRFNKIMRSGRLHHRDPAKLLDGLNSLDSTQFANAKGAFSIVEFLPEDLPLLYKAMMVRYRDFDSGYYGRNINAMICAKVQELDTAANYVAFARDQYSKVLPENAEIKPFFIGLLSKTKTKESYRLIKDLLKNDPTTINYPVSIDDSFDDSLRLSAELYPEAISLINENAWSDVFLSLTVKMIDSGLIIKTDLAPYRTLIVTKAKNYLGYSSEEKQNNIYTLRQIVKLLGCINDSETNRLINEFAKTSNKYLKLSCLTALIKNNQLVNTNDLLELAASDELRADVYGSLKAIGKESLFPVQYSSQQYFARSALRSALDEDGDETAKLVFFSEQIIDYNGKKLRFYLYKVQTDIASYLGIAGGYSLNQKKPEAVEDVAGTYWNEQFDAKKTDKQLHEFLKKLE
jgi:uncharacterized protein YbaP (TraB family)